MLQEPALRLQPNIRMPSPDETRLRSPKSQWSDTLSAIMSRMSGSDGYANAIDRQTRTLQHTRAVAGQSEQQNYAAELGASPSL